MSELPPLPECVSVRECAEKGRCCMARHALARGTAILSASPVACVLRETARATHCHWCFRDVATSAASTTLPRCSRCKYAYYCSRACQQAHWRAEHAHECAQLARLPRYPPPSVLLAARVLRFAARDAASARLVRALRPRPNAAPTRPDALPPEKHVAMALYLRDFVGADVLQQQCGGRALAAVELFGVLETNAFNVADADLRPVGVGLYPAAALFNHACVPNVSTVFVGRTVHLRTLCAVPAGAELCVSYVDLAQDVAARRAELAQGFGFCCMCPRCTDEAAGAAASARARATAPVPGADAALARAEALRARGETEAARTALADAVAAMRAGACPPHSVSLVAAQNTLLSCCIDLQRWADARDLCAALLEHYPCLSRHSPLVHVCSKPPTATATAVALTCDAQMCTPSTGPRSGCSTSCWASSSGRWSTRTPRSRHSGTPCAV